MLEKKNLIFNFYKMLENINKRMAYLILTEYAIFRHW